LERICTEAIELTPGVFDWCPGWAGSTWFGRWRAVWCWWRWGMGSV